MKRAMIVMMFAALVGSAAMPSAQAKPDPQAPSATDKLEISGWALNMSNTATATRSTTRCPKAVAASSSSRRA